jgi:hypothetical protein
MRGYWKVIRVRLGHEDGNPIMELVFHKKRDQIFLCSPCEEQEVSLLQTEKKFLSKNQISKHLDLGLFQNNEK